MCPRECFGEREDTWCYGLIETHGPFPPISPIAVIRSTSKRPRRMSKLTNDNGRLKMLAVPCTHLNFKPKWTTTWKTVPESHQYVNPQSMLFIDGDSFYPQIKRRFGGKHHWNSCKISRDSARRRRYCRGRWWNGSIHSIEAGHSRDGRH